MPAHKLELLHGGVRRFGLRRGSVTLSIEQIAHPFQFTYAERITSSDQISLIRKGDIVSILVDDEALVEGYVNRSVRRRGVDELVFEVTGRGAGQDLVDCSVIGPTHYNGATLDKIVGGLVQPFGYAVNAVDPVGAPFKSFKIDKSAKVFDAVMRACTMRGLYPRARAVGYTIDLVKIDATPETEALMNGWNCTEMEFVEDDTQLYSAYIIHGRTSETDDAYGGDTRIRGQVGDPSVGRYRPLRIDARGGDGPSDVGMRAKVERNRRLGNSEVITCRTDSWRDRPKSEGGLLWLPNQLRGCSDPEPAMQLDAADMLITTVKYEWGDEFEKGFSASLELKRREAFDPESSYPITQAGAAVR